MLTFDKVEMAKMQLRQDIGLLIQVLNSNAGEETRDLADVLLSETLMDLFDVDCGCDGIDEEIDSTPSVGSLTDVFK
jgi:hypothetical protein